ANPKFHVINPGREAGWKLCKRFGKPVHETVKCEFTRMLDCHEATPAQVFTHTWQKNSSARMGFAVFPEHRRSTTRHSSLPDAHWAVSCAASMARRMR